MHHHAELEFNLVTQGSGLYLLEQRKYEIRRGDLLWLFPAQEHVLVEQSPDFEMWIGVLKPKAVERTATDEAAKVLCQKNPGGDFCRRLSQPALTRLEQMFSEIVASQSQPGPTSRFVKLMRDCYPDFLLQRGFPKGAAQARRIRQFWYSGWLKHPANLRDRGLPIHGCNPGPGELPLHEPGPGREIHQPWLLRLRKD